MADLKVIAERGPNARLVAIEQPSHLLPPERARESCRGDTQLPTEDLATLTRLLGDVGTHVPVDRIHVVCGQAGNEFLEESRTTSEGFVITLSFMAKRILVTISERTGSFRAGP
jgi:hypothetical protein